MESSNYLTRDEVMTHHAAWVKLLTVALHMIRHAIFATNAISLPRRNGLLAGGASETVTMP